jgi:hypothetical protein
MENYEMPKRNSLSKKKKYLKAQDNFNLETSLILRKRNSLAKARGNYYNSDHATNVIRWGFLRAPSFERLCARCREQ